MDKDDWKELFQLVGAFFKYELLIFAGAAGFILFLMLMTKGERWDFSGFDLKYVLIVVFGMPIVAGIWIGIGIYVKNKENKR